MPQLKAPRRRSLRKCTPARKPLAGWANICPGKSPESNVYHFVTDETFEAVHGPPANWNPRHDRRRAPAPVLGQADAASSHACGHHYRERHRVGAAPGAAEKLQRDTQDEVPLPGGFG